MNDLNRCVFCGPVIFDRSSNSLATFAKGIASDNLRTLVLEDDDDGVDTDIAIE